MSNNIDDLLSDIYSSDSQSQGVKELANLINSLSQLLLKAISQLENRVLKLEQQIGRSGGVGIQSQRATGPMTAPATAPKPKVASPFGVPAAPQRTPPPPPQTAVKASVMPSPMAPKKVEGPSSAAEAASMLGVTLKKAPSKSSAEGSGPSFLTATVSPGASRSPATPATPAPPKPSPVTPGGATAPASGGVAGPAGGFRGELAEKLAKRRKKVQEQLESDFEAQDLAAKPAEPTTAVEESTSSELKVDLEEELRNAFSKLKG